MRRANSGHVGGDQYNVTDVSDTTTSSSDQISTNYYQQQYGAQWQYPSSSTDAATTTSSGGGGGGYSYPYSYPYPYQYPYSSNQQQPQMQPSSWPHSLQQQQGQNNVTPYNLNGSMEGTHVSHSHQMNQTSSNFQKPSEQNYVQSEKCEAQQMTLYSQGPNLLSSSTDQVTGNSHYYQQYGQWPYYYNPSAPTVSCPPGAENTIGTSASSQTIPLQATSGGYPYPSNQPPPPGTSLWNVTSLQPSFQGQNNMTAYNLNGSVEDVPPVSHNHQLNQTSSNFQKPSESNPLLPEKCEAQETRHYSQGQTLQPSSTDQVPGNSHYYQQYSQWPYYYNSSTSAVSCPPGAENTLVTSAPMHSMPNQATNRSYQYPSNQPPPPPGTTLWTGNSLPPSFQGQNNTTGYNVNGSWEDVPPVSRDHQMKSISSNFQKPLGLNPVQSEKYEAQEMKLYSQGPNFQPSASTNQVPETFQSPFQTATMSDTRRVSKMQIPTNPRIASSLTLGMSKVDKESSAASAALQPAYISVPVPKPSNKASSHDDDDAIMKGAFPTSLRGYVERTFARCKDDSQRSANQKIMKEVITKASADGSLFTRNWDIEPLFPLSNSSSNTADQNNVQSAVMVSMLPKYRRSPSKRTKSRWEPVAEEKFVEKLASVSRASSNVISSDQLKGAEKAVDSVKNENKNNGWSGIKFLPAHHQTPFSKIAHRTKKPRFSDPTDVSQNGDASSDSDKEQGLTKYYSSAIALANSPEEKKRRDDRSKRFKKGQERSAEIKPYKPKVSAGGHIYTRRGRAMMLARNFEDSCSRAVEDIDWDALTVKGTCQEVEKRYLRLTSAPDPSTVRPEEVLMKALGMVHTSQKNYLYKCDQLKSIRQDLTVQRIQNELTVKVYETHARLALEAGDLPEYNQCQSQLKRLYGEGIRGCQTEFSAYNLLCVILHSNNKRDLLSAMRRLSSEAKEDEAVKHALAVRSAVSSGNYILFFRLYKDAPNLNTCLMDLCVEKMRFGAIQCIAKSCRPTVPVAYIARSLGFSRIEQNANSDSKDLNRLDECEDWLKAHGATLTVDNNGELQLDTKISSSNLYMPESDAAVAHGDATLAVNDFFTRAPT